MLCNFGVKLVTTNQACPAWLFDFEIMGMNSQTKNSLHSVQLLLFSDNIQVEKEVSCLVTSVGQRKDYESP